MSDITRCLRALSNENRLAIFEYLRRHELSCSGLGEGCCVGDIAHQFDLAPSTVSHHVKELKEAKLIKCERHGQYTYCAINQETVEELRSFFSSGQ